MFGLNKPDTSNIDFKRLRADMSGDDLAAYFGGGIGPAMLDYVDVERASEAELLKIAQKRHINLNRYKK